ncbi:sigma factor-like helix-turn-helix DNA-binding protein [Oceanobacillus kapialis]|uniref:Sigma factor-like helix-turn-helix DNA-binding protein n=1 Tax=Oceanobacillus kapialis TaxID=481353 RepID=A0ABW5PZC7_9BACI
MYEWLREYQKLIEEIDYLSFRLDQSEAELKRWVEGDLQNVPLQRESIAANLEESIQAIMKEIKFKVEQRDKLLQLVDTFKGLDHRILKMKYVDGLTLEIIAEELNYSTSHIRKRHAELIRTIKFVEMYHSSSLT